MPEANGLVLGLDLGGTRMRAALATRDGAIARRLEVRTNRSRVADQILELAARCIAEDHPRLQTIAVGSPGPLDARTGVLNRPVNFIHEDLPLKRLLEERFGVPAHVQNDANVAALGEWKFGRHGQTEHLIYLTVSTGVGAGIISHGRLIDGFNTTAGEFGHCIVDPDGPLCGWGHRGCVEIISSGTSIARAAREALERGAPSVLRNMAAGDTEKVTAERVAEAARAGDRLAGDIFFHAADVIGIAVVNLIHLFSPEIVLIGGGVSQAGELLFAPVRERVRRDAMPLPARGVRIEPPSLGDDAGLLGAVALAMLSNT